MKRLSLVLLFATLAVALTIACTPPPPGPGAITDDLGRTVNIEQIPQRIVSLAPNITEILFALGLGDKVVGVTEHCDYPEEALDKPKVGWYFSTSLEAIIAQDPDIVFSDGHDPVCEQLEGLGVTMVVLQPEDIAGILKDIELVGQITGKEAEAEELTAEMKSRIADVTLKTASISQRPTVFYEVDAAGMALTNPWTAGQGSFIDALIALAGGENIVKVSPAWLQFSLESIVASDPDMIILGDHPWVLPEDVINRPGAWQELSAVKSEAIYPIDTDIASRFGPRIVDALEEMARIIHPELFP